MLTVRVPRNRNAERNYVAGVVLGEFLGLDWQLCPEDRADVMLAMAGSEATLLLPDVFLSTPDAQWLAPAPAPAPRLRALSSAVAAAIGQYSLPELFDAAGQDRPADVDTVDVFGTVFYLLTRYEEVVAGPAELDAHGRYTAASSVAGRAGLLHRPLVDEYVELLWHALVRTWPQLVRRRRHYRVRISCDVDRPFDERLRRLPMLLRDLAVAVAGGDAAAAGARLRERIALAIHGDAADPNFAFKTYFSLCEARGLQVTFNMLCGGDTAYDGTYRIDDPRIVELMRQAHSRGHAIGLHGSYASAFDPALLAREAARLRDVLRTNRIDAAVREGRQHYLRWRAADGWRAAEAAGLARDATLGYAEHSGFRCGTCHSFPVFDLAAGRALALREQPLVAMDVTLLSPAYQGNDAMPWRDRLSSLAATCRRHGGDFSLLWHNNGIGRPRDARLLDEALQIACRGGA